MPRVALTLLVIYPHKIVRADFARGAAPALLNFWEQPRPDVDDIGILVEAAALLGPKLRGAVWVLWSDLFAQALQLDAKSMGLEGSDLQKALAFEAEPLSGIDAFDSLVAYRQTAAAKGERAFWVVQARASDATLLRDTVSRLGGRLAGITATTGLDLPLSGGDAATAGEEVFREWLSACAAQLADKKKPTAIVPPARPLSTSQRWVLALALALPVGLLCTAQYAYVANPATARMKAEIKKCQDAAEQAKSVDQRIAEALKQKEALARDNEALKKTVAVLATQRRRVAALLTQLGQYRNDDLIILKIDAANGEPRIHGLCLQPDVATLFAHQIGDAEPELGWHVQAPKSEAHNQLPSGGPWTFEVQLKDVLAPADLIPAPKAQAKMMKK